MYIDNLSKIPTRKIRPIVDFITKHTKYSYCATLRLGNLPPHLTMTAGKAWRREPNDHIYNDAIPSLVEIWLSAGKTYPFTTKHLPATPKVTINSWQEEILLVLAHELRHIDQFWSWSAQDWSADKAEVDAELFAISLLDKWRAVGTYSYSKKAA